MIHNVLHSCVDNVVDGVSGRRERDDRPDDPHLWTDPVDG
ncbi:hypothetical protein DFJ68_3147 [Terracoccus luteus]|uniref:Uncharacterized protein n=1 Tax=Terracoccus luteus TaxID=53356 RepID=A0A495Y3I6_9MICO|nr:hypothetical protein [Terracoccus luteus]MCP2172921.1 hypothetical protein [Terracoccus luteus]RKT79673.1 hypothetical protein DFJ68_3147 [Terracoccus luteus]